MLKTIMLRSALIVAICSLSFTAFARAHDPQHIDVPAGELIAALESLAKQSGVEFVYSTEQLKGLRTAGVTGVFAPEVAVAKLLEGTKLVLTTDSSGAMLIAPPRPNAAPATPNVSESRAESRANTSRVSRYQRIAQTQGEATQRIEHTDSEKASDSSSSADAPRSPDEIATTVPEILVQGSKSLNMDIRRTEDDAQPYVVFDRESIERSGAMDVNDYLKQRLTMNSVSGTVSQASGLAAGTSTINLRGLGAGQTLILVDGRRLPVVYGSNVLQQPDINKIPVGAVERIEVLPATASGIYGGGATGGVVNVIMRRDYEGTAVKIGYENAFDGGSPNRQVEFSSGMNLRDGKTNLLFFGSFRDDEGVQQGDRSFARDYRERVFVNTGSNYAAFANFVGANPPNGYTTNIRSADGAALVLRNGTSLNSPITFVPRGYAGYATDNGAGFTFNAGNYNLEMPDTNQAANAGSGGRIPLIKPTRISSFGVTIRHEFSSHFEGFLDLGASDTEAPPIPFTNISLAAITVPASVATNPFTRNVIVTAPLLTPDMSEALLRDRNATAGLIVRLPRQWMTEVDMTWGRGVVDSLGSSSTPAYNAAVANGTFDVFRDLNVYPLDLDSVGPTLRQYAVDPAASTALDISWRAAGPVQIFGLPPITLTALIERRKQKMEDGYYVSGTETRFSPSRSEVVNSASIEARLPLIDHGPAGLRELELQFALRHDEYETEGATNFVLDNSTPVVRATQKTDSTDPTVGLRYRPLQDLVLRLSYGTGFLPPNVNQLATSSSPFNSVVTDPRRGNTREALNDVLNLQGGNPNLKPEKSTSWSAGFVFQPEWLPGGRLSLDYTRIEKTDNIANLPGATTQRVLDFESVFPDRVVRGERLPSDPAGWAGPVVSLDDTLLNVASAKVEAYDLQLDYRYETSRFGEFAFSSMATWQPHYLTQPAAGRAFVENVGYTSSNPLEFKANLGLNWQRGGWNAGWASYYFDSYFAYASSATPAAIVPAVLAQGNDGLVKAQWYHDVYTKYSFAHREGAFDWLGKMQIQAGIKNLLDQRPAFDVSNPSQGYYSRYLSPRQRSYYVSLTLDF